VLRMLRRDDEIRLSGEAQRRYARAGDDPYAKEAVTRAIQRQVVREAGFCRKEEKVGLDLLHSALALFPGDTEVLNSAFYLRNNVHFRCPVALGSTVPDVVLVECATGTSKPCSLRTALADADYTVVIAGSGT